LRSGSIFKRWIAAGFGALFAAVALGAGSLRAQDSPEREESIAAAERALSEIRGALEAGEADDVPAIESDLRGIIGDSRRRLAPVASEIRTAERSLEQLGPAPKEGEPAEAAPVAELRRSLLADMSRLQGQRTRSLAHIEDAGAMLAELSRRRLGLLYGSLAERGHGLSDPRLWRDGASGLTALAAGASGYVDRWLERQDRQSRIGAYPSLALIGAAILLTLLMIGPAHRWMQRKFSRRIEGLQPTRGRRVAVAGVKMLARLIPGVIGGGLIFAAAVGTALLGEEGYAAARAIWFAFVAFLLVEGFTSGLFSPSAPGWRFAPVEASKARAARALLLAIVGIYGMKSILTALAEAAETPAAFSIWLAGLSAATIGAIVIVLCRRSLWTPSARSETRSENSEAPAGGGWSLIRQALRLIGAGVVAAALAGYIPFADFIASRLYFLALVLAFAWFLRAALNEAGLWLERRSRPKSDARRDEGAIRSFWIGLGVDAILLLALAPIALVLAGLSAARVRDIAGQAFLGFRIGGISISIAEILAALALFFGLLALTRIAQRGLARGPFSHLRVDEGVQNSLTTLIGYVGLAVAAVVGITALGFDLSNLALIAGALSVGVGFGLQSVVNNFVSGLILLFERPVKAGDWIVTASGEGIVKKISVRSTEIETFDRSTIIVPNSELVSSTVTNWTHKDRLGRIIVAVGVAYQSDPEQVRDILLKCANDHKGVVRYPEPFVVWKDFGPSAMEFELRAFLSDITNGLAARTELRYAIFKAFKAAGVEIPVPQHDVRLRPAEIREAAAPSKPRRIAEPAPPRLEPEQADAGPDD